MSKKTKSTQESALTLSQWPEACPLPEEHAFLSCSIGNTNVKWAVHSGAHDNFSARTAWRTVHLSEDEVTGKDPFIVLSRYLSNAGLKLVFGETMQASKENALEAARLRPVHLLTIYFIANDAEQLELNASLWKDIPCRLIRLQPNDFFSKEQGRYESMGIDRLATLRCAGCTYGFPILVIDGGTCLTHTAADENGVIIGGGISAGFGAHVHSVTSRITTTTLKTEDLMAETAVMLSQQEALDPFPKTTVRAILTDVMASISFNFRRVIKQYIKRVGEPEGFEDDGTTPKSRHVVIIGGDEAILKSLLESDAPYFPSDETMPRYQIHCMKHAIALGLSFVLQKESESRDLKAKGKHGELMRLLMGKRVAKNFPDAKGNVQIFRGSITAVSDESEGSFLAMIKYDDDDVEELNPPDLYNALIQYAKTGETIVGRPSEELRDSTTKKKKDSETASAALQEALPEVKIHAEKIQKAIVEAAHKPLPPPAAAKRPPGKPAAKPPSAKKQKVVEKVDPHSFKGRRAAKAFGKDIFYGTIDKFTAESDGEDEFWHITYDDGDDEEYDAGDLKVALNLYEKVKAKDPSPAPPAP